MIDIRAIYDTLGLELTPFNTVASFTDATVDGVLVTATVPDLSLFGKVYVIFDSYVYSDVYLVNSPSVSGFNIDTPFVSDDPNKSMYNVSAVYRYYVDALNYINGLSCIDQDGDSYLQIVENYALYLFDVNSEKFTEREIEGKYRVKMNSKQGMENKYFLLADQLSGGCLSSNAMANRKITPLFQVVPSGDCRDEAY